jgi:hypothetical protein
MLPPDRSALPFQERSRWKAAWATLAAVLAFALLAFAQTDEPGDVGGKRIESTQAAR